MADPGRGEKTRELQPSLLTYYFYETVKKKKKIFSLFFFFFETVSDQVIREDPAGAVVRRACVAGAPKHRQRSLSVRPWVPGDGVEETLLTYLLT